MVIFWLQRYIWRNIGMALSIGREVRRVNEATNANYLTEVIRHRATTGILTVTADSTEATTGTYSLDGRKLTAEPTAKGLYIVNGKKVIIK